MRVRELFDFIKERQTIYLRRQQGYQRPWTKNPILQQYRFCNVYREQDRVTRWIAQHWRTPHRYDRELWFGMVVARLLNLPESLQALGWPVPWRADQFLQRLRRHQQRGENVFNAAYIIGTGGLAMDKLEYVATRVLTPIWHDRAFINVTIHAKPTALLADVHQRLTEYDGLGRFLAAQVIADLKYVAPLSRSRDWMTWAASGPGSRRGLNRLCSFPTEQRWCETAWLTCLQHLQAEINPLVRKARWTELHTQDLQNALCEWDKYERARLGQGRPKQRYEGVAASSPEPQGNQTITLPRMIHHLRRDHV